MRICMLCGIVDQRALICTVELLFVELGSVVLELTLAVFDMNPACFTIFVTMVTVMTWLFVIAPIEQTTVLVPLQLPCMDEAEIN